MFFLIIKELWELAKKNAISFKQAADKYNSYLKKLENTWRWHDYVGHGQELEIDWKKLGMDPIGCILDAPFIEDFQESRRFQCQDTIPMEPGKGWLLILSENR